MARCRYGCGCWWGVGKGSGNEDGCRLRVLTIVRVQAGVPLIGVTVGRAPVRGTGMSGGLGSGPRSYQWLWAQEGAGMGVPVMGTEEPWGGYSWEIPVLGGLGWLCLEWAVGSLFPVWFHQFSRPTSAAAPQFLQGERSVGQNRAEASRQLLAALNPDVEVSVHRGELSEEFLAAFQVVVLTQYPLEEQLRIGDICHARGVCFIAADAKGLAGQLFCDFGEHFVVHDPAEGDPLCATVQHISQGNPGIVTCTGADKNRGHGFSDGDLVMFCGVEGMVELNSSEPCPVRVLDAFRLEIGDTSTFSPYRGGGRVSEVRPHQEHSYALHVFCQERGCLPKPRVPEDAERVLELARELGSALGPLDEDVVRAFASVSAGELCPVASFIGALAAQEAMKAITGKFLPLEQWFYFDALECLAMEGAAGLRPEDCAPRGSCYDGQIAVFGADFQEQLGQQKYFVVGAGAIGCELLKNFAMMGLAAGPGGDVTVTDMDTVAHSNLHRQLLFREADVGKPKAEVAAAAVRLMNPDIRVTAHQAQLGPGTEKLFGNTFFQRLDAAVSALDTLRARAYLESCCIRSHTPLLDTGTEGTKGNVLAMVPPLSQPLQTGSDPADGSFPLCTLRFFPCAIEHTLQWARDEFKGLFQLPAESMNRFLRELPEEPAQWEAMVVPERVRRSLQEQPKDWGDCVRWARRHWQLRYHDSIVQLLHDVPPSHETSPGVPFWSGDRRCPHPLMFDPSNDTHLAYVEAAAQLLAHTYRLPSCGERAATQDVLCHTVLPPFVPKDRHYIPTADGVEEVEEALEPGQLLELVQELAKWKQELGEGTEAMDPISYDKDDDLHLSFITAASNLRAENYGIPPADRLTSQRIAGRIVPAIITTTAAVAALACMEVYKLVWRCRDLQCYRNSNLFLSECLLLRTQPLPAPTYWYRGKEWSCWDRLEVRAIGEDGQAMTVRELLAWLQEEYGWTVTKLLHGSTMLYDGEEDEEMRARQQAQRLSDGVQGSAELQQLELQYVCAGDQLEDACPPLLCTLP
ncbi:ubiquitin-like modifier-activating enzyme 7 isoform X3 [Coturnix japonica]|uniref:ubiquitin-like modifier-activating enzyme 7 isoform X3 n=1 Tax=Coturnix japonica TaxID=93934 RepID=UPI0007777394|nr:ubiquitin-like modifier-activating enzyme 7 isoform X3 [Coturnix japonica]